MERPQEHRVAAMTTRGDAPCSKGHGTTVSNGVPCRGREPYARDFCAARRGHWWRWGMSGVGA